MKDEGQFQRVEIWDGRSLEVSALLYPGRDGTMVRIAFLYSVIHLNAAHTLVSVMMGMALQDSQKKLLSELNADLETSLADYPDLQGIEDDIPF